MWWHARWTTTLGRSLLVKIKRNQALPFHLVLHQAVEVHQKLHLEVLDVEDDAAYEAEFHDVHP
uniref:Uncharacterized protein n=1 Tax=Meloidogyne incognita TaxID=6306 RepID=A0A914LH86_MELIC